MKPGLILPLFSCLLILGTSTSRAQDLGSGHAGHSLSEWSAIGEDELSDIVATGIGARDEVPVDQSVIGSADGEAPASVSRCCDTLQSAPISRGPLLQMQGVQGIVQLNVNGGTGTLINSARLNLVLGQP